MPAQTIQQQGGSRTLSVLLGLILLLSGASALAYEVLWQRQLALILGASAPAIAAVLSAYFLGLGLGGLVMGRVAARFQNPLKVYGFLEIAAGILAAFVQPGLAALEQMIPSAGTGPFGPFPQKLFLSSLVLIPPTFCLGATFPVLARLKSLSTGSGLIRLYMLNTIGGALGVLAVPFSLLPMLGLQGATLAAVTGSLLAGLSALTLSRASGGADVPSSSNASPSMERWRSGPILWFVSFLSGFVTLGLQICWNRAFAQVHENSIYSFAVILAVFISALALGGQLARSRPFQKNAALLLSRAWSLAALAAALGPMMFIFLTHGLGYLSNQNGWSLYAIRLLGLASGILLVPISLWGIGFPLTLLLAQNRGGSTNIGVLFFINVIGSVCGALLFGFLLPPVLALWPAVFVLAFAMALGGGFIGLQSNVRKPTFNYAMVTLVLILGLSTWNLPRTHLNSGAGERLLHLSEGIHGITAVVQRGDSRRLKLNNYYVLGGTLAAGDERMEAHLPLLLHEAPEVVAFLGLGTGISAGAALLHPVRELFAVELVPEVIHEAGITFGEANLNLTGDSRTRVIADDARTFLRHRREAFDVIIGDLVVPWRQGEGSLLTLEQFAAAAQALKPGGIYCQWVPLFQLSTNDLTTLVRTFLQVFPQAMLLRGDFSPDRPALALVGQKGGGGVNPLTIARRVQEFRGDPLNPHLIHESAFWMHFLGQVSASQISPGQINSEQHPWIELRGPLEHAGRAREKLCVGRNLQHWLREFSPNRRASPEILEYAVAGDAMAEFSLCLLEENQRGAAEARNQVVKRIPRVVAEKIFGEK